MAKRSWTALLLAASTGIAGCSATLSACPEATERSKVKIRAINDKLGKKP